MYLILCNLFSLRWNSSDGSVKIMLIFAHLLPVGCRVLAGLRFFSPGMLARLRHVSAKHVLFGAVPSFFN